MSRTIVLIDGENVVMRYQALLAEGRTAAPGNIHEKDTFVWRHNVFQWQPFGDLIRATYYTSAVGDDPAVLGVRNRIQELSFNTQSSGCRLNGAVFKKHRQSHKARSVDINMTIDALTHCYGDHADRLCLVTGDADFIPLVETLMRHGKQVHLWAFSSGLSERLRASGDQFGFLDEIFFQP